MDSTGSEPKPTIGALLRQAARSFGDADYMVTPDGRLSYTEAESRSAVIADRLLTAGVGKGTRVGLFFTSGIDWVLWWLAAARIGALTVPLSTFYPAAELARVLRLADVDTLIAPPAVLKTRTAELFEAALPGLAGSSGPGLRLVDAPFLRRIVITESSDRPWATRWDLADPGALSLVAAAEREVSPADLAVLIHTSGSTAEPKGVLLTHGTLVRQTSSWADAARSVSRGAAPRILAAMPFFWIGGILVVLGALHGQVALLILPRLDAGPGLDLLERERGTGVIGWPTFTERLRAHPTFGQRDLSSAPMLLDGPADLALSPDGEPLHRSLTESGGGFGYTDVRVAGADGEAVPDGEAGELWIRGTGSMAGYNKRERAEVFDPDGWYHTGDRVFRRAGDQRIYYLGRSTDLIKSAGSNISPLEVQAVIEGLPGVAQCVVVGVDDPSRGEVVCAVVVPSADLGPAGLDVAGLSAATAEKLSAYKVPARWIVTTAEELPLLSSSKPDRKTLRARIEAGSL